MKTTSSKSTMPSASRLCAGLGDKLVSTSPSPRLGTDVSIPRQPFEAKRLSGPKPQSLPLILLAVQRFERGQEFIRRSREIADARAGRVMNGVDHRRSCPADAEFAQTLAAKWAAVRVGLLEKDRADGADIGVYRHVIARQILVDERAVAQVHLISLHQRGADAPDHAADHLRARGLGVENAAGREHAEHAPHANLARIPMHADFGEMRAEGIMRIA